MSSICMAFTSINEKIQNGIKVSVEYQLYLLSIVHQSLVGQGDILGSLVRALADEPPDSDEDG